MSDQVSEPLIIGSPDRHVHAKIKRSEDAITVCVCLCLAVGFFFCLQHSNSAFVVFRIAFALLALLCGILVLRGVLFVRGVLVAVRVAHFTSRPRTYGWTVIWAGLWLLLSLSILLVVWPSSAAALMRSLSTFPTAQWLAIGQFFPMSVIAILPQVLHLQRERRQRTRVRPASAEG